MRWCSRRRRRAWRVAVAAGAFVLVAAACPSQRLAAGPPYEVALHEDVQYGTGGGEELRLHLAVPQGLESPAPAVLTIHGGGWAGGSKEDFTQLARVLAAEGFVAATIDYRLAPAHRFPAQVEDCKCAVRWLRAQAAEWNVDPQRIGAVGGSAGGHLAMMLGALDPADGLEGDGGWSDQSSKEQAVVSFAGPVNLVGQFPEVSQGILDNFLGGGQEELADVYRRASPVSYVTAGDAPMLLFQGTADVLVPYDQGFQMATALAEAGVPGRVELLVGENHGWGEPEAGRTLRATSEFLNRHLRP